MNCGEFRARFQSGTDDATILEHVRQCDACLDYAAQVDPDIMFRAIGGDEMVPPGGTDAFVAEVMNAIHVKNTENVVIARPVNWTRRWAIAAALAITIGTSSLVYRIDRTRGAAAPSPVRIAAARAVVDIPSFAPTKAVVETYSSPSATIVEVPNSNPNSAQVVMILDDSLPADL